ncbi:MAG: pyridoxine 5'-phosphate synthase, partial [Bacteroidetes bacterium]|nr:pyridoxine 5'-phosphate synthase [Bacteroidota bacterium]
RGGNAPDVVQFAIDCERFGADGITVHPRPDERHITTKDVYDLKEAVKTEFNIEGYPDERYMKLIADLKPEQATLVPDPPGVLTSNAGWNTKEYFDFLKETCNEIHSHGARSSIFIEPDLEMIEYAKKIGVHRIEFYTGPYAEHYSTDREKAIFDYVHAAEVAHKLGLGINAGHDLNQENLKFFKSKIPFLAEVSIGHAIISDALYLGIENTIQRYKLLLA